MIVSASSCISRPEAQPRSAWFQSEPTQRSHQCQRSGTDRTGFGSGHNVVMPWSWKLARIAGIDVYVHATFFMVVAWIALIHWNESQRVRRVVEGVGFILALFACVVLHEFGHALTAARYGIRTRDITLLPIGGLARLERMPDVPIQELWVALAGPAVNVVIALLLFGWLQASGAWESVDRIGVATGAFAERVMVANVFLAGFNLLPAFPMDGGRALRALLATRMEYTRATQRAAMIGQGMAILFGFIGLQGNPMLIFIALFVWIGAGQEASVVQMKSALAGIPLRRAMLTHFRTLTPASTLGDAVDLLLTGSQQDFPVVSKRAGRGHADAKRPGHGVDAKREKCARRRPYARSARRPRRRRCSRRCSARLQGRDCHTVPIHGARRADWSRHDGQCRRVPDDSGGGKEESTSRASTVAHQIRAQAAVLVFEH